ncbi:MAG: hypothetical protein HPY71_01770 [Firmicutes bacterium]|nr:hypothetical protein [Bacillota bacterium]
MSAYWVNIFYSLVTSGRKTVNDVPESIRQQVIDRLTQEGYVMNPDGSVTKV